MTTGAVLVESAEGRDDGGEGGDNYHGQGWWNNKGNEVAYGDSAGADPWVGMHGRGRPAARWPGAKPAWTGEHTVMVDGFKLDHGRWNREINDEYIEAVTKRIYAGTDADTLRWEHRTVLAGWAVENRPDLADEIWDLAKTQTTLRVFRKSLALLACREASEAGSRGGDERDDGVVTQVTQYLREGAPEFIRVMTATLGAATLEDALLNTHRSITELLDLYRAWQTEKERGGPRWRLNAAFAVADALNLPDEPWLKWNREWSGPRARRADGDDHQPYNGPGRTSRPDRDSRPPSYGAERERRIDRDEYQPSRSSNQPCRVARSAPAKLDSMDQPKRVSAQSTVANQSTVTSARPVLTLEHFEQHRSRTKGSSWRMNSALRFMLCSMLLVMVRAAQEPHDVGSSAGTNPWETHPMIG